mmetsp:Transcript_7766/g.21657  ORF Transcript_7766/g.21657 Transcript_7766/m.21657 type:complete len:132 (+) Transcript_7766:1943-2338(+)
MLAIVSQLCCQRCWNQSRAIWTRDDGGPKKPNGNTGPETREFIQSFQFDYSVFDPSEVLIVFGFLGVDPEGSVDFRINDGSVRYEFGESDTNIRILFTPLNLTNTVRFRASNNRFDGFLQNTGAAVEARPV